MINDYDYLPIDEQFEESEDTDLFSFESNTKAQKHALKDLKKELPQPSEEEELIDEDAYAADWINITEDDGEDD